MLLTVISGCSVGPKNTGDKLEDVKIGMVIPTSDLFSFLDQLTVTRWAFIESKLKEYLSDFSESNKITKTYKNVSDEVKSINALVEQGVKFLFVAPLSAASNTDKKENDNENANGKENADDNEKESDNENENDNEKANEAALLESLNTAKKKNVFTIGWGEKVNGFVFDIFVETPSPAKIGERAAEFMVESLKLNDESAKIQPKTIEILLDSEQDEFSESFFKGAWAYLKPYFENGKLISPSGIVDKNTLVDDYESLLLDTAEKGALQKNIENRIDKFYSPQKSKPGVLSKKVILDGVIASNDILSNALADGLTALNFNPEASNANWPVITGFGGYKSAIVDITNNKQKMTIIYDTIGLSRQVADEVEKQANKDFNNPSQDEASLNSNDAESGDDSSNLKNDVSADEASTSITITTNLEVVTQKTLMKFMISPGYITPADAGL
jgi:ABC-type xylose transport system substrate-binding protein